MDSYEERVACPYNKSHLVHPLRMPYHLMKCRKKHPDVRLAVCPYSALHEVPPVELQYHMANCPDKRLVEGIDPPDALLQVLTGREPSMLKGCTDIPSPANIKFDEEDDTERWDEHLDRVPEQFSHPSPATQSRCRLRQNTEANGVHCAWNKVPADVLVRRPKSHSVAEKLRPTMKTDTMNEKCADNLASDSESNFSFVNGEVSSVEKCNSFVGSPPKQVASASEFCSTNLTSRLSSCMVTENDTHEEKIKLNGYNRPIPLGRGRGLLNSFSNNNMKKTERCLGHDCPPYPMIGRGR